MDAAINMWCRFWASIGECRANIEWMNENCQLACATCRSNSAPLATLVHPPPRIQPTSPSVVHATNSQSPVSSSSRETSFKAPIQKQGNVQRGKGASSCAEIADKSENAAEQLASSGLLQPVEDVAGRQILSLDDITRAVPSGCVPELNSLECSRSLCFHLAYRSMDGTSVSIYYVNMHFVGTCNNLKRPLLGASFRAYLSRRPTPREASRLLLASSQMHAHEQLNSTLHPTANCGTCDAIPSKCVPVTISNKDTNDAFRQKGCLKISRAVPVCGTGNPSRPREQLNENTAFVDGSQIYGSSSRDL
uniref:ShKT domain-containing protein n=1 Tax=Meloidogyne javanica TaxID=6303 RepID=A0A915MWB5_MELJA